jgi:hypothetical protein
MDTRMQGSQADIVGHAETDGHRSGSRSWYGKLDGTDIGGMQKGGRSRDGP